MAFAACNYAKKCLHYMFLRNIKYNVKTLIRKFEIFRLLKFRRKKVLYLITFYSKRILKRRNRPINLPIAFIEKKVQINRFNLNLFLF